MKLEVVADKETKEYQTVDYKELFQAPASHDDLFAYNELLGRIVASAYPSKPHLISPTLTRIEAQTGFFDRVCRHLSLARMIDGPPRNLRIENLDRVSLAAAAAYAREKGFGVRYNRFAAAVRNLLRSRPRFFLNLALLTFNELLLAALSRILLKKPAEGGRYVFVSFFDYRSVDGEGRYRDHYFQPVLEHLRGRNEKFVVIVNLLNANRWPRVLGDMLAIRKMGGEVAPAQRLLSFADIFRTAFRCLGCGIRFSGRLEYKGKDISGLLGLSLREDLTARANWFFALKHYELSKRICGMHGVEKILYPFENHPWEKMFVLRRNESGPRPALTAFQHTSFSFKLLNHFPSEAERNLPVYPDRIFTVGRILKETLEKYGHFPSGVLREGCALRHAYLFADRAVSPKSGSRKAAFAFSSDRKTYAPILKNLEKIFAGRDLTLYLKTHPLIDEAEVFPSPLPAGFIKAKAVPWDDLFPEIDLLLCHDNSLGVEAFRFGVDSCYFNLAGDVYDCNRLFQYTGKEGEAVQTVAWFSGYLSDRYGGRRGDRTPDGEKLRYLYDYFIPITEDGIERFLNG